MALPEGCKPFGALPSQECYYKDSGCFKSNAKCIAVYEETGCRAGENQYQCAEAFYQSQQNQLLQQSGSGAESQKEDAELKSQIQGLQQEIESLKTQQGVQSSTPQGNLPEIAIPYLIIGALIGAAIVAVIMKIVASRKSKGV